MLINDVDTVVRWVARRTKHDFPATRLAAIGMVQNDAIVAGVVYDHYNENASITASIAVDPGTILTREFLWTILAYPFKQLKVGKIIAYVAESNEKSRRFLSRLGFVVEARVEGVYQDGGMLITTLTEGNCKLLERMNNHGRWRR